MMTARRGRLKTYPIAALALVLLVATSAVAWAESPRSRYGAWSPDGSEIVFEREIDGDFEIFLMRADGTHLRRLTESPGKDGLPSFSPDGDWIVFGSERESRKRRLYLIGRDGGGVRALPEVEGFVDGSVWSPDGEWIVFDAGVRGSGERYLYRVRPDGRDVERLQEGDHGTFSPDGRRLAYSAGEPGGFLGIYMLDLATGESLRVSRRSDPDFGVHWSRDGARLALCSSRDHAGESVEIYVMAPDGSDQNRLTDTDSDDCYPRFSPDGAKILFTSWRTGQEELFLMNPDGSGLVQLTGGDQR